MQLMYLDAFQSQLLHPRFQTGLLKINCFLREEVIEFVCDSEVVWAKNKKKSMHPPVMCSDFLD